MSNTFKNRIQQIGFSLTSGHLRLGLAVLSIVALALGGSASAHWD